MGYLRFRRSLRVVPGVRLNFNKRGISTSVGVRGAHLTLGSRGTRTTVGVPGTGLSYTSMPRVGRGATQTRTASRGSQSSALSATPANLAPTVPLQGGPGIWIAWGVAGVVVSLLLVVPTAGISMVGLVAAAGIMAWGYRMSRESRWQALALVKRARKGGPDDQAIALLDQALHVDPSCATALFDSAQRLMRVGRFAAAADYYQQYLYLSPAHTYARTRLADAFLRSSQADAAIPVLVELSADDSLSASTQGSITAELAHVYLVKGDLVQAAELANSKIASKRSLDEGQRQCLRVRAMAQYLGGHRAAGIRDMDRLYAMDPTDVEVQRLRDAMTAETFTLGGNTPPLAEAS